MTMAIERPHRQYGSAIFVKTDSVIEATAKTEVNNIETLTVEFSRAMVTSVYKPPDIDFIFTNPLPNPHNKAQIVIKDFNSHSTQLGYTETNSDGEAVEVWMDANQLSLIHDPKQPSSFNSARWKRSFNPDLTFTSNHISGSSKKLVLDVIPRTQHHPIGVQIHAAVLSTTVPFRRRFNNTKSNWEGFTQDLDHEVRNIKPPPENYSLFTKAVQKTARRNIPVDAE